MTKAINLLRAALQPAIQPQTKAPAPLTRDELESLFGDLLAR